MITVDAMERSQNKLRGYSYSDVKHTSRGFELPEDAQIFPKGLGYIDLVSVLSAHMSRKSHGISTFILKQPIKPFKKTINGVTMTSDGKQLSVQNLPNTVFIMAPVWAERIAKDCTFTKNAIDCPRFSSPTSCEIRIDAWTRGNEMQYSCVAGDQSRFKHEMRFFHQTTNKNIIAPKTLYHNGHWMTEFWRDDEKGNSRMYLVPLR